MPTVFISHATHDAEFARRLADDLQRLGVEIWITPESIQPGESWVSAIERGLEESSHMVVVLTPAALESPWVKKETEVAIARERRGLIQIIPLALDVQPWEVSPLLSSYQMVSFRRDYDDAGLSQLAERLSVSVPPPEPVRRPLVNWKLVGLIAGVIVVLIALGVWLVPSAAVFLSAWLKGMIYVPAGEFRMGSDGDSDEQPAHTVYLDAFYIDKYEVTNAQYRKCVEAGVCGAPVDTIYYDNAGYAQHPVVYVSWDGADAYCRWAGRRLPTEAEWEKACRGTTGWTYPWGEGIDCDHAQYSECGGQTVPVGSKPKGDSRYGAWDMAGNVWEWVADWYDSDYYSQSPARNPPGPDSGEVRVLRGGSWQNDWWGARCPCRSWHDPRYGYDDVGFRCARSSP